MNVLFRNGSQQIRDAYGLFGASKERIVSAKICLLNSAEGPSEFLEVYNLVHKDRNLEEIFFERIRTISFTSVEWKYLYDYGGIFGLGGLRDYSNEKILNGSDQT